MPQPQIEARRRRAVQHYDILPRVPFEQQGRNVFGNVGTSKDLVEPELYMRSVALGDGAVWIENPPLNGDVARRGLRRGDLEQEFVIVSHRPALSRC